MLGEIDTYDFGIDISAAKKYLTNLEQTCSKKPEIYNKAIDYKEVNKVFYDIFLNRAIPVDSDSVKSYGGLIELLKKIISSEVI